MFRKFIYDVVKEVALEQEGWFMARTIAPEVTARSRFTVTSKRVGHYLSTLCDKWVLTSRMINEGILARTWEYHRRHEV